MLDVLDLQRRYYVFDKSTFKTFIKMCNGFTAYTLEGPTKSTSTDIFYDSDKRILEENGLLLRKRIQGAKSIIKLKRRFSTPQDFYSDALRKHEREKEVLKLVAKGANNDTIAKELFVKEYTVKAHLNNIFKKLKVKNRTQAVLLSMQMKITD